MKYFKNFMDSLVHKILFIKHGKDAGFSLSFLIKTKRENCSFYKTDNSKLVVLEWLVNAYQYKADLLKWYTDNYFRVYIPEGKRKEVDYFIGLTSIKDYENNLTWKDVSNGNILDIENCYYLKEELND